MKRGIRPKRTAVTLARQEVTTAVIWQDVFVNLERLCSRGGETCHFLLVAASEVAVFPRKELRVEAETYDGEDQFAGTKTSVDDDQKRMA